MYKKNSQLPKAMLLFIAVTLSTILISCGYSRELDYYSKEDNYIVATGTIIHIAYSSDQKELYLAFSDLEPSFDDNTFKIVGKNFEIVQENGIYEIPENTFNTIKNFTK